MRKIIIILCVFFISVTITNAVPYKCDRLGIFDNKNACDTFCTASGIQRPCTELTPKPGGKTCETGKYQNFAYIDGKTYAVTKTSVSWSSNTNLANIRNDADNKIIASLLRSSGVNEAWIGIYDPSKSSTSYGNVDPSRFKTLSGSNPVYTSWKEGEPNNAMNYDAIGSGTLYGEYWAVTDASGKWNDVGLNADGSEKLLPAVVEFQGELSCVAGSEKDTSNVGKPTGMVCGEENNKLGFTFESCSQGEIFGGGSGFLCPKQKMQCIESVKYKTVQETIKKSGEFANAQFSASTGERQFKWTVSNNGNSIFANVERRVKINTGIFGTHYEKKGAHTENLIMIEGDTKIISTMLKVDGVPIEANTSKTIYDWRYKPDSVHYEYEAVIEKQVPYPVYTCPQSGRPCIDNGGKYYCSKYECSEGSSSGSYEPNPGETPEGSNDADNNGETDGDGNCLGKVTIFPGRDGRCRMPGTQSKFFQCCKTLAPEDVDKPDIVIFPDILDFEICNGSERQLAVSKGKDMCVKIGKYCAEKWQGFGCVQYKETYCCFDSDFSRAFNEAGMDMLGRSWGFPESPQCGGFTPTELQYLNGAGITNHPKLKEFSDKLGKEFGDKFIKEFDKNFDKGAIENQIQQQVDGLKQ